MPSQNLQKSAETGQTEAVPKEVLNPEKTAKQYSFRIYGPAKELAPFIDYYWIMRWNLHNKQPFTAEVIPSPYTNLTFMPEGSRITGVTTGKYTYELKGAGAIVGAKFQPGGLHAFWKKDLQTLTDTHVSASGLFPEIDAAYNSLMLAATDDEAVKQMEQLLRSRQPRVDKNFQLVTGTLSYLETVERPSLANAVEHSGLSERRLQEIFREYVGVGVKWIILRARLIRAVQLAATLEHPNWTVIALEMGYADQPHFINDFKRVIGKTPTQYAAEINQT